MNIETWLGRVTTGPVGRAARRTDVDLDCPTSTPGSAGGSPIPSKKIVPAIGPRSRLFLVALALLISACEPRLVVGSFSCGDSEGGLAPEETDPDPVPTPFPWQTGFEDGFCGFADGSGLCYANPEAAFEIVSEPVHSGNQAAAFTVGGDYPAIDGLQARCARYGILPDEAYYGAWFFIAEEVTRTDNWNLFHFDGEGPNTHHDLWDVSLGFALDGSLRVYVFDFLRSTARESGANGNVPVGRWFHLEVFWRRATDRTGAFRVLVDGETSIDLTDIVSDDSASAEWYVGNLATELSPRPNVLYVDDISISATSQAGN